MRATEKECDGLRDIAECLITAQRGFDKVSQASVFADGLSLDDLREEVWFLASVAQRAQLMLEKIDRRKAEQE